MYVAVKGRKDNTICKNKRKKESINSQNFLAYNYFKV